MKKRIAGILTAALIGTTVMGTVVMAAPSGAIDVISREDGSGTRGAFVEMCIRDRYGGCVGLPHKSAP